VSAVAADASVESAAAELNAWFASVTDLSAKAFGSRSCWMMRSTRQDSVAQVTVLDAKNQRLALGLAVNRGLRTLLAYAAETELRRPRGPRTRHDLTWIGALVR
jgi:hypothetical protein